MNGCRTIIIKEISHLGSHLTDSVYGRLFHLVSITSIVFLLLTCFSPITYAKSLLWKASPSNTNEWFNTEEEAVADFRSVADVYTNAVETSRVTHDDGHIKITYEIPEGTEYISPWVYHKNNQMDCPNTESVDELFDCFEERYIDYLSGGEFCPPIYEINRSSGEWVDYEDNSGIQGVPDRGYRNYEDTYYRYQHDLGCYETNGIQNVYRERVVTICSSNNLHCDTDAATATVYGYPQFFIIDETNQQCPKEGNPCNPATGGKTQVETDYISSGGTLKVQRYYSSQGVDDGFSDLGPSWRHNHSQRLNGHGEPDYTQYHGQKSPLYLSPQQACSDGWDAVKDKFYRGLLADGIATYDNGACMVQQGGSTVATLPIHNTLNGRKDLGGDTQINTFNRANGSYIVFRDIDSNWQPIRPGNIELAKETDNWILTTANDSKEVYDEEGKLLTITTRSGQITNYNYDDDGRLSTVTDHFGKTINYQYDDSGRLIIITTPDGDLNYSYDSIGRLDNVTYPDSTQRNYHYEDNAFPNHLTGITDENGDRYATWAYDTEGRAVLSEHADGVEKVEFIYNPDGTTTVSDSVGAVRIYNFVVIQGDLKVSHINGDRCVTCPNGGVQAYSYDTNGFVTSETDWNGNTTTYSHDARGLELNRTVAAGTPDARTITTEWHPQFSLPTKITEPGRITEYTYDAQGRQRSRSVSGVQ